MSGMQHILGVSSEVAGDLWANVGLRILGSGDKLRMGNSITVNDVTT